MYVVPELIAFISFWLTMLCFGRWINVLSQGFPQSTDSQERIEC